MANLVSLLLILFNILFLLTGLPEDKAVSTLPTTASLGVETVEESIHEEIHKEAESAVAETKVGQRSENDFEEEKKVPEV